MRVRLHPPRSRAHKNPIRLQNPTERSERVDYVEYDRRVILLCYCCYLLRSVADRFVRSNRWKKKWKRTVTIIKRITTIESLNTRPVRRFYKITDVFSTSRLKRNRFVIFTISFSNALPSSVVDYSFFIFFLLLAISLPIQIFSLTLASFPSFILLLH